MAGLSPKLPLSRDSRDGFALNKTYQDTIQQNFKNLLLTAPGERVMIPEFGVGLRNYLFENQDVSTYEEIEENIRKQVLVYMPFVTIGEIKFLQNEISGPAQGRPSDYKVLNNNISYDPELAPHRLNISISYYIEALAIYDLLEVSVDLS